MAEPITVSKVDDGVRLMRWFLRRYPSLPSGEFYKMCRGGQIRVNSSRCKGQEILRAGDMVRIPPTVSKKDEGRKKKDEGGNKFSLSDLEQLRKTIIHSDDDIVIFNKPSGLAVQGGSGVKKSVDKMAAALFPYDKISLVHRLDKETSGILIVAKNQRAAQSLAAQFQGRDAHKEYLALLDGGVNPKFGVIDSIQNEKRAITKYKVLGELPGVLTWILFEPQTGRNHQLRLHASAELHAPIFGDGLYGSRKSAIEGPINSLLQTNKLFLFAHKITFQHPGTRKQMSVRADLPEFMKPVIKFLEFSIPQ